MKSIPSSLGEFKSIKDALRAVMVESEEFIAVRHELSPGERIPLHSHAVEEWVIIGKGCIRFDFEREALSFDNPDGIFTVIHLPAWVPHGLKTESNIEYHVIRRQISLTILGWLIGLWSSIKAKNSQPSVSSV
jgi:quercetin dioxygenase-like cupin family protein